MDGFLTCNNTSVDPSAGAAVPESQATEQSDCPTSTIEEKPFPEKPPVGLKKQRRRHCILC